MTDADKDVIYKWLKRKSVADWLVVSAIEGDTWIDWIETSIDELEKEDTDALILFAPEVIFIMEWVKIHSPKRIVQILLEFYKTELKKAQNGEESRED